MLLAMAVALGVVSPARADGDPASDYLVTQNVFLPFQQPSATASTALEAAVAAVYAHGNRIKVALIYAVQDLGSVPSLIGHPADYAQFHGTELTFWYGGPLLVVMPGGLGIYEGGSPITAAENALQSITVDGSSPDGLATAATTAVNDLESADDLNPPDRTPPLVTANPAVATLGKTATLHFEVYDDSGRSSEVVGVYQGHSRLAAIDVPMGVGIGTRSLSVHWRMPAKLASRNLSFCVVATDPSGNKSRPGCAPFLRIR